MRGTGLTIERQELLGSRRAITVVRMSTLLVNEADEAVAYDTSKEIAPRPRPPWVFLFSFVWQVEVRAANEIDEAVAHAVRGGNEQSPGGAGGSALAGGERVGSPVPVVSRPSRPGRGRARLTKRS